MRAFICHVVTACVVIALWSAVALAIDPDEQLSDPALEARARAVSKTLRCVVCQSQSIDESNAPLAKDLRILVRQRLVKGEKIGRASCRERV